MKINRHLGLNKQQGKSGINSLKYLHGQNSKSVQTSSNPFPHEGLGLDKYGQVTSPIRRYLDLIAHRQIINFINNRKTLEEDELKEIISISEAHIFNCIPH